MFETFRSEAIYLWYYFELQLRQIFAYWLAGIIIGSVVSVFFKGRIHALCQALGGRLSGIAGWCVGSILGIACPLCMYGTIPICASFSQKGIKDDFLSSFMMSSILLNPQLIIYSTALGAKVLAVRIISCFACGVTAGLLVHLFYSSADRRYFNFSGFDEPADRDTDSNMAIRLAKNIGRNIKATGIWFIIGIALSAVFQRYVPAELVGKLFGSNRGFGLLMAATVGVPLYVCGGGTIPLLMQWLADGMSVASAAAFMITGPATKITNLGALKIALGIKHFVLYIVFVIAFALLSGAAVGLVM